MRKNQKIIICGVVFFVLFALLILFCFLKKRSGNQYYFNFNNQAYYINMMYDVTLVETANKKVGVNYPSSFNEQKKSYYEYVTELINSEYLLSSLDVINVCRLIAIDYCFGGLYHDFLIEQLQLYKNGDKIWNVFATDQVLDEGKIISITDTAYGVAKIAGVVTLDELEKLEIMNGLGSAYIQSIEQGWLEMADERTQRALSTMYSEIVQAFYLTNQYYKYNFEFVSELNDDFDEKLNSLRESKDMLGVDGIRFLEIESLVTAREGSYEGISGEMFAKLNSKKTIIETMPDDWAVLVAFIEAKGDVSQNHFYLDNVNEWLDEYFNSKIKSFKRR